MTVQYYLYRLTRCSFTSLQSHTRWYVSLSLVSQPSPLRRGTPFDNKHTHFEKTVTTSALPNHLQVDPTILTLSETETQLLLGTKLLKYSQPELKVKGFLREVRLGCLENSAPLFFSIITSGQALNLPFESVLKFITILSHISYKDPTIHRELFKWGFVLGLIKGGRQHTRFYIVTAPVISSYFPDRYLPFLISFLTSICTSETRHFYNKYAFSHLIQVFSDHGLVSQPTLHHLLADPTLGLYGRSLVLETFLGKGYLDEVYTAVVELGSSTDRKTLLLLILKLLQTKPDNLDHKLCTLSAFLPTTQPLDNQRATKKLYFQVINEIHRLGSQVPVDSALNIFSSLLESKVYPPWRFYTYLLAQLKRTSNYRLAKLIYQAILQRCQGVPPEYHLLCAREDSPNCIPFTAMVQAAFSHGDVSGIEKVYQDLAELHISRDDVTYVVLIHHLKLQEDYSSIYELYKHLILANYPLSPLVFASFLDGLGRSSSQRHQSRAVFLEASNQDVLFTLECLSVLFSNMARCGYFHRVVRMWEELHPRILEENLLSPHLVSVVLKSLARVKKDPLVLIDTWVLIHIQCPHFRFSGGNFVVVLSHLMRLLYGKDLKSVEGIEDLLTSTSPPGTPITEQDLLAITKHLPSALATGSSLIDQQARSQLARYQVGFPIIRRAFTKVNVSLT